MFRRGSNRWLKLPDYFEKVLLSERQPDAIIGMDDLGGHKGRIVRPLIYSAGAKLFCQNTPSVLNAKFVRFRGSHFHELRIHKAH
ncbi:hypothetical protein ACVMB1_000289 [Bradyrhizobium sp. USDA 4504]